MARFRMSKTPGKNVLGPHRSFSWATRPENVVGQVFFERDARRACRGATCHTPRSDLGSRAGLWLVLGLGFMVFPRREAAERRRCAAFKAPA